MRTHIVISTSKQVRVGWSKGAAVESARTRANQVVCLYIVTALHARAAARPSHHGAGPAFNFGSTLTKSCAQHAARVVVPYVCGFVKSDSNISQDTPTVLVMDDEPIVREVARRFLHGSGYGCVEADSVDGALEVLRTTSVIAAMLDMRLPDGRTGLDALTNLRRLPEFRTIPVLIVTGSVLTELEVAAIAKQRAFVFFKPEGFSTIVNFLDRLTGRDRSG